MHLHVLEYFFLALADGRPLADGREKSGCTCMSWKGRKAISCWPERKAGESGELFLAGRSGELFLAGRRGRPESRESYFLLAGGSGRESYFLLAGFLLAGFLLAGEEGKPESE